MTRCPRYWIVVLGFALAVLTSCRTETTPSTAADADPVTDSAAAAEELDTAQAALVLAALVADPLDPPTLNDCPFDPLGDLLREALADVDTLDVIRGLRGDFESAVLPFDAEAEPVFVSVSCTRFAEDFEGGFGMDAAIAPDEFDTYLTALTGTEPGVFSIQQQPTVDHRGGRLERLCARDLVEGQNSFCEVSWLNDEVLITLYVSGPNTDLDDLPSIEAGLTSVLDRVVQNLAAY